MDKLKITSLPGFKSGLWWVAVLLPLSTCVGVAANSDTLGLVPLPQTVERSNGFFQLQPQVRIFADADARDSGE
jgi:hypothetical protein